MRRAAAALGLLLLIGISTSPAGDVSELAGLWEMTEFEGPGPAGRACFYFGADGTIAVVGEESKDGTPTASSAKGTYRLNGDAIVATMEGHDAPPIPFAFKGASLVLQFTILPHDEPARVRFDRRPWAPSWCARGLRELGVDGY